MTCKPGRAYRFPVGGMRYCGAFLKQASPQKAKIQILSDKSVTGKHWSAERVQVFQTDNAVRQTTRSHKSRVNVVLAFTV